MIIVHMRAQNSCHKYHYILPLDQELGMNRTTEFVIRKPHRFVGFTRENSQANIRAGVLYAEYYNNFPRDYFSIRYSWYCSRAVI